MWTKEDLQGKYVKLSSQQDYDTVVKVLHEFGFEVYKGDKNDKYYEQYPFVKITPDNVYYLYFEPEFTEIPIQQFYEYLSNKSLKVEDLVEGEIYLVEYPSGSKYINLSNGKEKIKSALSIDNKCYRAYETAPCSGAKLYKVATTEEKKWLNVCIKQDRFIPKEDLDLYDDATFELKSLQTIPEYVECYHLDKNGSDTNFTIGKIYKLKQGSPIDDAGIHRTGMGNVMMSWKNWFKPSTKEAFEAQNKPKFEVGKWYKYDNSYIKFRELRGDIFIASDDILHNRYDGKGGLYGHVTGVEHNYILLTDLSEIQQYLPLNHPDKIKPMKINEFKKGDYIVYLNTDDSEWLKYNYCYIQNENHKNHFSTSKDNKNGNTWSSTVSYNSKLWRYATPEEIAKYNKLGKPYDVTTLNKKEEPKSLVGRYLKALVDSPNCTDYKKGDYIQIKSDNLKGSVICEKNYLFGWDFYDWQKSNVELMPEGFIPPKKSEEWIPQVGEFYTLIDSEKNNPKWGSFTGILEVEKIDGKYLYPKNKHGIHQDVKLFRKCLPHEIPNTTQEVKEMLLEKAKLKYPVGTKYKSAFIDDTWEIKTDNFKYDNHGIYESGSYVYYKGKWAEIVELPESSIVSGYSESNYSISPLTPNEVFQQEGLIDATVNKIQSVSVELYQPEELQLF